MNILLTSVGRRSYLVQYFKAALEGRGKVFVSNSSAVSPAFSVADEAVVSPLIYDQQYLPFILDYCKKNQIKMVISLFDIDLPVLSLHKQEFAQEGIHLLVSDYEIVQICNDKWRSYLFLKEHHFMVPATYLTLPEARTALAQNKVGFPLLIKPRWGMGSIGIYQAQNDQELEVFYQKCQRDISNSYLKYESQEDQQKAVIIQEMIAGQEYGLDIINDLDARYQTTIVKKKIAMRSGETDCAQVVDCSELRALGKRMSESLKHIVNLDLDIIDQDGNAYIIDLNARFGGGYPFSHMAGVNLPRVMINWVTNHPVDQNDLTPEMGGYYCKDIVMKQMEL